MKVDQKLHHVHQEDLNQNVYSSQPYYVLTFRMARGMEWVKPYKQFPLRCLTEQQTLDVLSLASERTPYLDGSWLISPFKFSFFIG
ncbi:hypothetical protein gpAD87_05235 [Paenibacillus sp. AD87]|nr:hypothetical protein gpAD87_05235 [Paenibacillus sp. AD87]